jgi:hypothetical protein
VKEDVGGGVIWIAIAAHRSRNPLDRNLLSIVRRMLLLVAVLASARPSPTAIAVDATQVYWIESDGGTGSRLMSVPKTGGTVTNVGKAGGDVLLTDGERLFFVDPAGIESIRPGGITHALASGEGARGLVIRDRWIYWLNAFGELRRVARAGGIAETVRSGLLYGSVVAIDDDTVYGVSHPVSNLIAYGDSVFYTIVGIRRYRRGIQPNSGMVLRMPKGGGEPIVLAAEQNLPGGDLVRFADYVYWTNTGDTMLMRVAVTGGAVGSITRAVRFTIDTSGIYATTPEGDVVRVALDGRRAVAPAARRAGERGRMHRARAASCAWPAGRRRDRE